MRLPWLIAAAFLWTLAAASAGSKYEWREAVVELSNGKKHEGKIHINEAKFRIYSAEKRDFYWVGQDEPTTVETFVEKEWQEKKWIWKEDGRSFKLYTGEMYPIRQLTSRVTFADGSKLEGPIYARPMYVKETEDSEPIKLILLKQLEGKVGEKLDALVYVKKITFKGDSTGVNGTISGTVSLPPGETFLKAHALNEDKGYVREGQMAGEGAFKITGCTQGTYDIIVRTDKSYYMCFNREKEEDCSRFDAGELQEVHDWIVKLKDLWEDQKIVYGGGNDEAAFVFARMERRGELQWSDPAKWAWVKLLRRNEVWYLTRPYEQWQIKERLFIGRELLADPNDAAEHIIVAPELGGHVISPDKPDLILNFKLGPNKEVVVPPAKEKVEADDDEDE